MNEQTEPQKVSRPKPAIRWLTYLLLLPLIALSTTFFGCISLVCGLWDTSGRQQHFVARVWARTLLVISLSPVQLIGAERFVTGGSAVYASNHLSYYDTPVLFAKLPFQFRILAQTIALEGPLYRLVPQPLRPGPHRRQVRPLRHRGPAARVKTLQAGLPLVIFPEGGRAEHGTLTPFQSGAAFMAIKAQVPLVPIALVGTYELLPIHTYHLTPRPIRIVIGEPIPTAGLTTRDADRLTEQLFTAISFLYFQHTDPLP